MNTAAAYALLPPSLFSGAPAPELALANQRDKRLLGFLLLSLLLHTAWLMLPLRQQVSQENAPRALPLEARLSPVRKPASIEPAPPSTSAAPRHIRTSPTTTSASPHTVVTLAEPQTTPQVAPPAESSRPAVDMQQVFSTARSIAKEWKPPPNPLGAPALPLTVETAVAKATAPDVVIETHGAAGEYVTKSRNSHCVTPIWVPHYLEGKSMLTQCTGRKG